MLILAIMYSPLLKKFLSQPVFVYLGGLSFPLYLLHGTFIRIPLTYLIFRFLPQFPSLNAIEYLTDWEGIDYVVVLCDNFTCRLICTVLFFLWFASLLAFCQVWKDYVDIWGVHLSKWAEDVVLGKRSFLELTMPPTLSGRRSDTEKVL
jgi:hypothetical protein